MVSALEVLGRDALGKCRVLLTMRYKIIVCELDSLSGVTKPCDSLGVFGFEEGMVILPFVLTFLRAEYYRTSIFL